METCQQPTASEWLKQFQQAEQQTNSIKLDYNPDQPCEDLITTELIQTIPDGSLLFSGNSLPIRHLDSWSGSATKTIRIVANRGASGIDGNISTLLGLKAASKQKVVGLLGDLTFYHDMNGLLAAREVDAVIVLLNNGGGGIFSHLPQAQLEQFNSYWLTPTHLDFNKVADLYGLNYHLTTKQSEFRPALETAITEPGLSLLEVVVDRNRAMTRQRAWLEAIRDLSI
jgi:2-succinyl-5-enolpyruvyl-6-hydroxy-3-cyclohexene-1-carboxylate synthase